MAKTATAVAPRPTQTAAAPSQPHGDPAVAELSRLTGVPAAALREYLLIVFAREHVYGQPVRTIGDLLYAMLWRYGCEIDKSHVLVRRRYEPQPGPARPPAAAPVPRVADAPRTAEQEMAQIAFLQQRADGLVVAPTAAPPPQTPGMRPLLVTAEDIDRERRQQELMLQRQTRAEQDAQNPQVSPIDR